MDYYNEVTEMLSRIQNEDYRNRMLAFHAKFEKELREMPASRKGHHMWPGGYITHVYEVMCNITEICKNIPLDKEFAVSGDEIMIAAYIHDLDKLFRYKRVGEPATDAQVRYATSLGITIPAGATKQLLTAAIDAAKNGKEFDPKKVQEFDYKDIPPQDDSAWVRHICAEHDIPCTLEMLSAIAVHHGGWAPVLRAQPWLQPTTFGAILHSADLISSHAQNGNLI